MSRYHTSFYALSDIGLARETNQDFWFADAQKEYFLLADGMGGHQSGDVAAKEVVHHLSQSIEILDTTLKNQNDYHVVIDFLYYSFLKANSYLYSLAKSDPILEGMGTTICCIYFYKEYIVYLHVGDSRIYCLRQKKIKQLTEDHSLYAEMVACSTGSFKSNQKATKYRHILTKAMGTKAKVEPAVNIKKWKEQDLYLICSDGLSDYVSEQEIQNILLEYKEIKQATQILVQLAKARGGKDNITVLLLYRELLDK